MFLALRELSFARGRFALMGSVVTLVAVLTVLLSGLSSSLVDDGISGLRALPVSHLGFQKGADSTFSRSTVDSKSVATFDAAPGAVAEPFRLTLVNATNERGQNVDLALMGMTPDGFVAAKVVAPMSLIRGFLHVISAMILGSFFTVWIIQRRAEIVLQKALGAAIGFALGKLIEGGEVPFALDAATVLRTAAVLVVSGAIGMAVGIRKVTSVDPIIALGAAS
ncbi:MAG: hypothetical protein GX868_12200 [Actinobacteria bacterium]|nr:hypothetical protein [Actinomycetota bacterium]